MPENAKQGAREFVSLVCPECGGELRVAPHLKRFFCNYCGSEVERARLIDTDTQQATTDTMQTTTSVPTQVQLIEAAFKAGNDEEAYRYASLLLEHEPGNALAWMWKGILAGFLSTPGTPRIQEMLSYLGKAQQFNSDAIDRKFVASQVSCVAAAFLRALFADVDADCDAARNNIPRTYIIGTARGFSAGFARGLTRGLTEAWATNAQYNEVQNRFTVRWHQVYAGDLIAAIAYAWSLDTSSEVADNLYFVVWNVRVWRFLPLDVRQNFLAKITPLVSDIKAMYRLTIPPFHPSGERWPNGRICLNCGYDNRPEKHITICKACHQPLT
jgi:ribosomal protein S27AE